MTKIFVSYSRADHDKCVELVRRLQRLYGYDNVWFDDKVHGGAEWWELILSRVEWSDIFVFLVSRESLESAYCKKEFSVAMRRGKKILPILIRARANVPPDLARFQWIDASNGFTADTMTDVTASINELALEIEGNASVVSPLNQDDQEPPHITEEVKLAKSGVRWQIIGVVLTVVIGLLSIIVPLLNNANSSSSPTATATAPQVAQGGTHTSPDPLALVGQTQTLEVEQTLTAMPTATFEPTADLQATLDVIATGTRAALQTANAATLTAVPTLTPIPLGYPGNPVTSNDQWIPITQEFGGVTMVFVPPGCFMMGSEGGGSDEQPVHQICFDEPFWIDQTEVTNGQYGSSGNRSGTDRPRERITWFEARDFCASREARLPTEAEWEYAARGPSGWEYPWGNDWISTNAVWNTTQTANVGSIPAGASWVGALDMSGNVWEWASSLYQPYPVVESDGREADNGDKTGVSRAIRGGAWNYTYPSYLRAAYRVGYSSDAEESIIGFRCARSS